MIKTKTTTKKEDEKTCLTQAKIYIVAPSLELPVVFQLLLSATQCLHWSFAELITLKQNARCGRFSEQVLYAGEIVGTMERPKNGCNSWVRKKKSKTGGIKVVLLSIGVLIISHRKRFKKPLQNADVLLASPLVDLIIHVLNKKYTISFYIYDITAYWYLINQYLSILWIYYLYIS